MANDSRDNHRPQAFPTRGQITFAQRILRWIADALGPSPATGEVTLAQRILRGIADALDPTPTQAAAIPVPAQAEATAVKPFLTPEEVRLFEVMN